MTNPKASEKEMLDTLEHCRLTMTYSEVQALAGKWNEHDEETMRAIRSAILEHGRLMKAIEADQRALMAAEKLAIEFLRLKKKVGEWSKKMEKYFVEGRISIPCRAIDWNKMTEFFKEIRDLGGEGEK